MQIYVHSTAKFEREIIRSKQSSLNKIIIQQSQMKICEEIILFKQTILRSCFRSIFMYKTDELQNEQSYVNFKVLINSIFF